MSVAAHPAARLTLAASGTLVGLLAQRWQVGAAAIAVASSFLLLGQWRLAGRLLQVLAPLALFAATLRLFVDADGLAGIEAAFSQLLAPHAPLAMLLRAMIGSCAIVLALATIPDGQAIGTLRRIGVPRTVALVLTSGAIMASSIAEAQARSLTALRAQGLVRASRLGRLAAIPATASLTWTSALALVVTRAEVCWAGNRFVERLERNPGRLPWHAGPTLVMAIAGIALAALSIPGPTTWR